MSKILYTGQCRKCHKRHERQWEAPYVGADGEAFYPASCQRCGSDFWMDPDSDELDAYREAKLRRLADEMEAAHRADPRPVLVDAETEEVWSHEMPSANATTVVTSTSRDGRGGAS